MWATIQRPNHLKTHVKIHTRTQDSDIDEDKSDNESEGDSLDVAKKSLKCRLFLKEFPSTFSLKVHLKQQQNLDDAVKCHLYANNFFSKRGVKEHWKSHREDQIVEPSVSVTADTGDNITAEDTDDTITEVIFEDAVAMVEQIVTEDGLIQIPVEGFGTEMQDVFFSLVELD